jgi:hypothetical protein
MTPSTAIQIYALVEPEERAALELAARHIAQALEAASAEPWSVNCCFPSTDQDLSGLPRPALVVTSLLHEAGSNGEWQDSARRLRARYGALTSQPGLIVYVSTLFRHVPRTGDELGERRTRVRLRRLNLLALELSRELGVYVIDLDRDLADIGARSLETGYRLSGPRATLAAARAVATTLLEAGLDEWASAEVLEMAASRLPPSPALPDTPAASWLVRGDVTSAPNGRRAQKAIISSKGHRGAILLRGVLTGRTSIGEVLSSLVQVIRNQGPKQAARLVIVGLTASMRPRQGRVGRRVP